MFEQAPQPEHAHVVIPHEVGGDLERVAHLIIDAVRDALGEASLREHIPGRGDIGRDSFVPLVSHFGGHSLDADTDRTRSCRVESSRVESSRAEPGRVGHRQARQFGVACLRKIDRMVSHGPCGAGCAEPDENAFDHGMPARNEDEELELAAEVSGNGSGKSIDQQQGADHDQQDKQ